ncbi:MAG TPA: c-type cytochrome, partial [Solirubrobacteraceae bacterium]
MAARVALVLLLLVTAAFGDPTPEDRARYVTWCARCHGQRGDGRGPAAVALAFNGRPPRDFTAGRFKVTSTAPGSDASDADLTRTIARGLPGTSMPYFGDLLDASAIEGLVGVVRSFARARQEPGTPLDLGPPAADTPEGRARGAQLYQALACWTCHGEGGGGDGPSASGLRNEDGSPARPADLTRPWTFVGGDEAGDIAMRVATGVGGTPMPGYAGVVGGDDLWHLAHHVRGLARAPTLEAAAIARAKTAPEEAPVARGEYLVKSGTCFLCHVQMRPDGSYVPGSFGAGGMPVTIDATATVFSRNLTPDVLTGLGSWTADDLRRALREGTSPGGRRLNALDMPWTIFAGLTDADVDAIHAYLASLPPVRNLVPPPEAPDLRTGTLGKLRLILTGRQIGAGYFPGNAGRPTGAVEYVPPVRNPDIERDVLRACVLALLAVLLLSPWLRRAV